MGIGPTGVLKAFFFLCVNPMLVCLFVFTLLSVCVCVCLLPFFSETSEDISMKFGHKVGIGPKGALKLSFVNPMFVCLFVCLSVCLLPFFSETSEHISMKF